MTNIFFLSPEKNFHIRHLKATAKFDNANKGKLRLALRVIAETTQEIEEELKLLILIKNEKEKLKIEDIEDRYNKRFYDQNFRSVAGAADRFISPEDKGNYVQFEITKFFKENPELKERNVLYPKSLKCRRNGAADIPENLKQNISDTDIVVEVTPRISPIRNPTLLIFQFAIVLDGFVEEDTLSKWRYSGKVWSVNFDFHEKIGYQDFFDAFGDMLTYPEVFELWVYIPKGHYLNASSPHWERAFNLGIPETQYKVTGKKFETDERDIAVKLINKPGELEKFSIICISPYIGEEQLAETEKKIKNVQKKIENFPSWRDFLQNMMLTVALFSLLIGVIVILAQQALQSAAVQSTATKASQQDITAYFPSNFALLVEISIFIGFSLWGIYASLKIIAEKYKEFEFLACIGLITLGSLGILSQIFQGQDFIKVSIILISILFILFGLIALKIRSLRK